MKRKLNCLLIFIVLFKITISQDFYFGFDTKIPIVPIEGVFVIRLNLSQNSSNKSSFNFKDVIVKEQFDNNTLLVEVKQHNLINAIKESKEVVAVHQAFQLEDGMELYPTEELIVKYRNEHKDKIELLVKEKNLEIVKRKKDHIILKIPKHENVIHVGNYLFSTGYFTYAYPNFYARNQLHETIPNDTYFGNQFNFRNTGQTINDGHTCTAGIDIRMADAWDITQGNNNILIAVLDQGVTPNHPDLPNARQVRLNGSNFADENNPNDPTPNGNDNHGNSCAGLIAATMNNNEGIAGIAPNCRIMPVRIPFGANVHDICADAIDFAVDNGANILSNSWGYSSSNPNLFPVIVDAITDAIANGRVVVFSAGNTADHNNKNAGYVGFPASSSVNGLIVVGACDRNGSQANYSPTSNIIDVVAPSHRAYPSQITGETFEVWTIDIPGNTGYNPCNANCDAPQTQGEQLPDAGNNFLSYTGRFGGTSAACPQIAGIAALLLSENPCLTPLEVESIIQQSAQEIGGYTYTNGRCNEVGFGLANAFIALNNLLNIFIQNETFTGTNFVRSTSNIIAGFEVTNEIATGNVVISNGSNTIFRAGNQIILENGFSTENGTVFIAEIQDFTNDCNLWVAAKTDDIEEERENDRIILSDKDIQLKVYPTVLPSGYGCKIVSSQSIDDLQLIVYDLNGRLVLLNRIEILHQNTPYEIPLPPLAKGFYLVKAQNSTVSFTQKIIIQ